MKAILLFDTLTEDYLISHLFEHCLANYFSSVGSHFFGYNHSRGTYFLVDNSLTLGEMPDLSSFIDLQKKRIRTEHLENIYVSIKSGELFRLECGSFDELVMKLDQFNGLLHKDLLTRFKRIYKSKKVVTDLSETFCREGGCATATVFPRAIKFPKFVPFLDTVEVSFRFPVDVLSYFCCELIKLVSSKEDFLSELASRSSMHKIVGDILVGKDSIFLIYSAKVLVGEGEDFLEVFLNKYREIKIREELVEGFLTGFSHRISKLWKEKSLNREIARSFLYWGKPLSEKGISKLDPKSVIEKHDEFARDPFCVLKDY